MYNAVSLAIEFSKEAAEFTQQNRLAVQAAKKALEEWIEQSNEEYRKEIKETTEKIIREDYAKRYAQFKMLEEKAAQAKARVDDIRAVAFERLEQAERIRKECHNQVDGEFEKTRDSIIQTLKELEEEAKEIQAMCVEAMK
ncbi:hypothetical protein GGF37_005398 [Kickxella alabastrina]|uniref:Uncharacterized protein n=2 Tax=Kickxella alabastrina TaxID=61397 RepID=A0ACC1IJK3_9FUNG|nr:hypothetical protein LPJ66_004998 [Kickxella alabastrina]KAJ1894768.1 hypothetical protein LPJ66_004988 [Kickxella alabastrina]KAJ1936966.1 hypothetical protein GGF37_005398 [Kickxella alabastrina]